MCSSSQVGGGGGTAAQPGRVHEDPVPDAVIVSLVVVFVIVALGVLTQVAPWAKGAEKAGYLLLETVFFLVFVVYCFVTFPLLIIRMLVVSCAESRETTGSHCQGRFKVCIFSSLLITPASC